MRLRRQGGWLPEDRVRNLVESAIDPPFLGMIGESRVNVLQLNSALDQLRSS